MRRRNANKKAPVKPRVVRFHRLIAGVGCETAESRELHVSSLAVAEFYIWPFSDMMILALLRSQNREIGKLLPTSPSSSDGLSL